MKRHGNLIILVVLMALVGCVKEKPNSVQPTAALLDTLENPIRFHVGQQWSYRQLMIMKLDSSIMDTTFNYPETTVMTYEYSAIKDTMLGSDSFLIIECLFYDYYPEAPTLKTRFAVHFGVDTIVYYAFKDTALTGGFSHPLLRTRAMDEGIRFVTGMNSTDLRRAIIISKMQQYGFDTTQFTDLNYPMVFPLILNKAWYLRPALSPTGGWPMQRIYLGQETISVNGRSYPSYKIQWAWPDSATTGIKVDVLVYQWVSTIGTVKRFEDWGRMGWTDEAGRVLGYFRSWDIYEYMGP